MCAEMRINMRQYELAIRIAQVHHLVDERKYKKALAVIQTLDMRQVRSLSDLKVFAEVYTKTEQYEAAKATYLRVYRRSRTRRVLYRLIYLSIRTNSLDDAESYYQEFVRMNPNARDALILRYRIDKAAGVPVGQLIEILQELKQEEYIEEWAYELAKLYHRAGRRKECMEECEDILLWFGTGEIVERAKILIDHLKEKDPIPYYDDKDFTVPGKEEPNPDDTGSLPDLSEFIKERRAQKKEERLAEKAAKRAQAFKDDYEDMYREGKVQREQAAEEDDDGLVAFDKREVFDREEPFGKEEFPVKKKEEQLKEKKANVSRLPEEDKVSDDTFIDDYEEDDFEQDGLDLSQKAKDGIQKLSDLLKLGKKEEEQHKELPKEPQEREERKEEAAAPGAEKSAYVPHSQSGTGITQDLAKEISAIYEMEQRDQLKEKAVTVITDAPENVPKTAPKPKPRAKLKNTSKDAPNIATNVVERMTQAIQKTAGRGYIPIDIEEIHGELGNNSETLEDLEKTKEVIIKEEVTKEFVAIGSRKNRFREEPQEEPRDALMEALDEEVRQYYEAKRKAIQEEVPAIKEEPAAEQEEPVIEEEPAAEQEKPVIEEEPAAEQGKPVIEEEPAAEQRKPVIGEEPAAEKERTVIEEKPAMGQDEAAEEKEPVMEQKEPAVEVPVSEREESVMGAELMAEQEEIAASKVAEEVLENMESGKSETELLKDLLEEEIQDPEDIQEDTAEVPPEGDEEVLQEEGPQENALENYHAPEIPVVETDYMKVPEIAFEDLPTTRALQQSFQNVLKLIAGELDPSHFVLMGNGTDRIVGVSKRIVRVMKETGYLSQGRIAKIHAEQLNKMDLITFRSQLKGNCLLVEGAADLLFPTITKIFSIMEEYFGDFVVILADDGTTLDQLFRFVPVLAKKFKYIIDISHYTEDDYK